MESDSIKPENISGIAKQLASFLGDKVNITSSDFSNKIIKGMFSAKEDFLSFYMEVVPFSLNFNGLDSYILEVGIVNCDEKFSNLIRNEIMDILSIVRINGEELGYPCAIYKSDSSLISEYPYKDKLELVKNKLIQLESCNSEELAISDLIFLNDEEYDDLYDEERKYGEIKIRKL